MPSIATENFIKAIYKFEQGSNSDTRPGSIAKELGITNAAATDMARKLARKNLIDYEKYRELRLTPKGQKIALEVIRRHRLWETFLHRVLGLTMYEIHREAELLEHLTSDFLTEKISQYLGHPAFDPHGDPIPDKQGLISPDMDNILLSDAPENKSYEISRLSGSDREFADFCHSNKLAVGTIIRVNKQFRNGMTEIVAGKTTLLLHIEFTGTIFVKEAVR